MRRIRAGSLVFPLLLLLLLTAQNTFATPELRIIAESGGTVTDQVFILDEGPTDVFKSLPGWVGYSGLVGSFFITGSTGNTPVDGLGPLSMSLNSFNAFNSFHVSTATSGTLRLLFSEAGFAVPSSGSDYFGRMTISPTTVTNATVTYNAYASDTNSKFATVNNDNSSALIGTLGPITAPTDRTLATSGPILAPSTYSLTQELLLDFKGAGAVSGDPDVTVVPEPGSIAMLGGALLIMHRAIRRRFQRA